MLLKKILIKLYNLLLIGIIYPIYNLFREMNKSDVSIVTASVNPIFHNWGDDVSIQICKLIAPHRIFVVKKYTWNLFGRDDIMCIGSIITWMTSNRSIIWGSGVVYPNNEISAIPKKVLAVRGPLTRRYLLDKGIECPEVYGDPALLFPRYYQPKANKKYKLGIIPHFRDKKNELLKKITNMDSVLIIDVQKINPWHKFIDDICSCEAIVSSSLHGIIIADAYNIPNEWVEFPGGESKRFAFMDYMQSVKRDVNKPSLLDDTMTRDDIISLVKPQKINIDIDRLIMSCPFLEP